MLLSQRVSSCDIYHFFDIITINKNKKITTHKAFNLIHNPFYFPKKNNKKDKPMVTENNSTQSSETPVELLSDQGIFYNNIIDGGDGIDTLKLSCEYEPNQPLTSYKNIEVVDITNSPQYHAMDWYINGEVKKVVSKYGMNINIDDYNGITNKNGVGNLVDLIDRFNDSTHELFLKSDVEGHKLLLQGMNPWFFQKSNEQNVSELLDSMGVKMTKGEDTYKLDFDHNDSHYALTVSNTISLIFVEPIVDHL